MRDSLKMINLSISLVTYKPNLKILTEVLKTLSSSLIANDLVAKLYLIDNSCESEWQEKIKICLASSFCSSEKIQSEFIINSANTGYGRANNIGIDLARSDYHLVLNPDVLVTPETFSDAFQYMEKNPEVGLLTPAIFGENGEQHFLCKKNPTLFDMFLRRFSPQVITNKFAKRIAEFEMRHCDYNNVIENIPFPSGCFMFFRTSKLKELKGFDPDFFMYYEDADIGRRMLQIAKTHYVPQVRIIHKWKGGSRANLKLKWLAIKSGIIYWKKWGGIL